MGNHRLSARVEEEPGAGTYLVRAPGVGVLDRVPRLGRYLDALESFLSLTILGERRPVILPRGVHGRVVDRMVDGWQVPVEYDQPLVRLRPGAAYDTPEDQLGAAETGAAEGDLIAVPAPSDGVFYCRPGPERAPYVDLGAAVEQGTVLGLVEVMKSFNQIVYGGPGLPERGRVERILVEDSAEVALGQTLFLVRPVDERSDNRGPEG
jgi:acetyl-CoA carboxylase biotin carboxyl carrier protein